MWKERTPLWSSCFFHPPPLILTDRQYCCPHQTIISRIWAMVGGGGFPGGISGGESACQCRRPKRHRFAPWVGKITGGAHGNPLQNSCLENPMDSRVGMPWSIGSKRVRHNWSESARTHTRTRPRESDPRRPLGVTRFVAPPPLPAGGSLNRPGAPKAVMQNNQQRSPG